MSEQKMSFFKKETDTLTESKDRISEFLKELEKDNALCDSNLKKLKTGLTLTTKNLANVQEQLTQKNQRVSFITDVINAKSVPNNAFEKYQTLLNNDYLKYANNNESFKETATSLLELQKIEKELELLTYDDALLNKTIIAIAGSFSSGKSSFMNSFFTSRKVKLPTGMDRTTAISSFIMDGSDANIMGYSYRGGRVNIPEKVFSLFSYGKIEDFYFNMKEIIRHIVFKNTFVKKFNHLCFIDTPGFNPGLETQSDYETATEAISNANAIIWCFDCSAGTIKNDELIILADIQEKNSSIKTYVIANKADLKSHDEHKQILDEVERQLKNGNINFEGVGLYSSQRTFIDQDKAFTYHKGLSLLEFLNSCDVPNDHKARDLVDRVEKVFDKYINADNDRIVENREIIRALAIFENTFSSISEAKDEQLQYYKSRIDSRRYKPKDLGDTSDDESHLLETMFGLRQSFNAIIEKDTKDIKQATELCTKMQEAIAGVFNLPLKSIMGESKGKKKNAKKNSLPDKKFCRKCGTELKLSSRFCTKCGTETL